MPKYSRRLAFFICSLIILSLGLVACGGDTTPAPASSASSPTAATTTKASTSSTIAAASGADAVATATPVVLASLPPAPTSAARPTATAGAASQITPASITSAPGLVIAPTPTALPTAALPQISPAPLSAFNVKSVSSFGLDQKTVIHVLNLVTPIGAVPPTNQPGTFQSIALVASTWKMAPPLFWCEDTADKLKTVWAALSFSMTLDKQPVDLKPFQAKDFDDDGTPCKAIDVALGATPAGLHSLSVTRKVLREVDSGPPGRKLSPGDYTYEILLYSAAPKPNGNSTASIGSFGLGSSKGSQPVYATPGPHFAIYSDTQEQYKPGTFKYTAAIFADEQYGIVGGWCAKDQTTLEENWKKMTYTVTINGQAIDLTNAPTYDSRQLNGQFCRSWDLSMTPPEGQHSIVIKLNFKADTNDGIATYAAGDYISDYVVLSVKPNL